MRQKANKRKWKKSSSNFISSILSAPQSNTVNICFAVTTGPHCGNSLADNRQNRTTAHLNAAIGRQTLQSTNEAHMDIYTLYLNTHTYNKCLCGIQWHINLKEATYTFSFAINSIAIEVRKTKMLMMTTATTTTATTPTATTLVW